MKKTAVDVHADRFQHSLISPPQSRYALSADYCHTLHFSKSFFNGVSMHK